MFVIDSMLSQHENYAKCEINIVLSVHGTYENYLLWEHVGNKVKKNSKEEER